MAKIRGIKPETWSDEKIVALSPLARLLFIGSWNWACDNGHIEDSPIQLKIRILPADNCDVNELMDEIIDAFRADAFHVGMDEVFLLGSEKSPSTKGKDPGVLFANAVKELHNHLVRKRRVEMLMWGDRLIDAAKYDYGEWEAAKNGTATAIEPPLTRWRSSSSASGI